MIPRLASPSVCVIDDEDQDSKPILDALLGLGLGCVHIRGDFSAPLPSNPFKGLRLVFADLHLSASAGKSSPAHTANVFRKVVSTQSAPIVVVIWSKYANDKVADSDLPPEDQPTECELFKKTLFEAEPLYKERLIFTEMPKPKAKDRPSEELWINELKVSISAALEGFAAFDVIWSWETLVRDAGLNISGLLTNLAGTWLGAMGTSMTTIDKLSLLLKYLAQQQGGPDCSEATASRHLLSALSQLSQDEIETISFSASADSHGAWLAEKLNDETKRQSKSAKLNSLLLTTSTTPAFSPFAPGTVYIISDFSKFETASALSLRRLQEDCFNGKAEGDGFVDFCAKTKPFLLEVSPACDFHQGHRRSAMLIAGIACPANLAKKANSKDACKQIPIFEDRFLAPGTEWTLAICSRYRITINQNAHPDWLKPWLRLRDILMTDIRNWNSNQAARVGYLSF